ncbi:MAG: DUF1080 domain-containing protein [Pirellulales bacterium]
MAFACLVALTFHIAAPASHAEPQLLPQDLLDQGWIELFDGETLYGWRQVGKAKWSVANGAVSTDGSKPGWLMTTTEWADFELHAEFKAPATTNSGIFLRTALEPTDPTKDCYELNIAPPGNPFPTGSLVGRAKAASLSPASSDDWHSFDVRAYGGTIAIRLDGESVAAYTDPSPLRRGRIGLQSKEGAVAFRNVRLRPLGLKPLFDGKDLKGWSLAGAEQSEFTVTEKGELQLKNGPGQIASDDEFRNFVMQMQCKVNGDGLNSGVFFRTLREGRWMGYESQINNRFNDGDRTKPADFGTGGIYRRQPARRVVADDHQWLAKTIVADGPHFAVWVNGLQVSDWTDARPEKENPREGLRLGPGVIAIQGHDPTTDFLFRDIRIAELPE